MLSWSSLSACRSLSWPISSTTCSRAGLADRGKQNWPGKSIRAFTVFDICGDVGFGLICWNSSNRVQPSDHISCALSYYFDNNMSSGARYQRVPTLSDKWRGFFRKISLFCCTFYVMRSVKLSLSILLFSCLYFQKESRRRFVLQLPGPTTGYGSDLDTPKSPILTLKSDVIKMLDGLMSLCMTPAECKYFSPHIIW